MGEEKRNKTLRHWVYVRDGGVCAICHCDTELTQEVFRHALTHLRELACFYALRHWREVIFLIGFNPRLNSWWEADHIHPLSEGGADTLENLRTLCLPCHKRETKLLQKRLAKHVRLRRKQPQVKYQTHHLYHLNESGRNQ